MSAGGLLSVPNEESNLLASPDDLTKLGDGVVNAIDSLTRKASEEEEEEIPPPPSQQRKEEDEKTMEKLEGYDEESSTVEIRKGRSVYRRTVTLRPPPPPPPPPRPVTPPLISEAKDEEEEEEKEEGEKKGLDEFVDKWKNFWGAVQGFQDGAAKKKEDEERKKKEMIWGVSQSLTEPKRGKVPPSSPRATSMWDLGHIPSSPRRGGGGGGGIAASLKAAAAKAKKKVKKEEEKKPWVPPVAPVVAKILFVHGSCSSSAHFDALLRTMYESIHSSEAKEEAQQKEEGVATEESFEVPLVETKTGGTEPDTDEEQQGDESSPTKSKKPNPIDLGGAVECHLFDTLGCGKSSHPAEDWDAFAEKELDKDLDEIFHFLLKPPPSPPPAVASVPSSNNNNEQPPSGPVPIFIIAHAFGTSQVLRMINAMYPSERSKVHGVMFVGGALSDGPVERIHDGMQCSTNTCIWRLPDFVLDWLQPRMSDGFLEAPFHGSSNDGVGEEEGLMNGESGGGGGDVRLYKAFYRQNKWASSEDAAKMRIKSILVHGQNDKIIPVSGSQHFNDALPDSDLAVIADCTHHILEERPDVACEILFDFISPMVVKKKDGDGADGGKAKKG